MATAATGRRMSRAAPAPLRWLALLARNLVFVISGLPVHLAPLALLALPWLLPGYVPVGFWLVLATVALSLGLVVLARVPLTFVQRHRCWSLLGVDIPPVTARGGSLARRFGNSLRSEASWRQLAYHVLVGPILAGLSVGTLGLLVAGAELAGTQGRASLFPKLSAALSASSKGRIMATALGIAFLLGALIVACLATWVDRLAATALLGPSRALELERRVENLAESRAGVVDAADAERRRIERDLHDGAQQRLVSLAMNLGIARATLTDLPAAAEQVIAAAHDEAKEALAELRNLVRGLHPAVLNDRGLDAALSGIAARAPLPVRLTSDLQGRASPTIEAVAYFVVSECLANIARHSNASQAAIDVRAIGGVLRVQVTDDGIGGAEPARGTGLDSLVQRARSVDGSLRIDSPVGGPTEITVELPCAL